VLILVNEREAQGVPINWQFSIAKARRKLNRHYQQLTGESRPAQET
jgi:selenophosphate synthetase-related protein